MQFNNIDIPDRQLLERKEELLKLLMGAPHFEPDGGAWFVEPEGTVSEGDSDRPFRLFGVERDTEEAAQYLSDEMYAHNMLLAYRHTHEPYYSPDWDDEMFSKHTPYYNHYDKIWASASHTIHQTNSSVWFSETLIKKVVEDLNSGFLKLTR